MKILSTELDRLNQDTASLAGTLNDAKTVQKWTDNTIGGSTLLSPGTDKDIVSYVQACSEFTTGGSALTALIPSVGAGIFAHLTLGVNDLEMMGYAFGTLIVSHFSLHPFFWSRSQAGKQQKTLKANLENVVDKWLYERYQLEVHPSGRKKIIRNLLNYNARIFEFKAVGAVTAQMSCTEQGWFVHDIRSAGTSIPSVDDDLVRFALHKNESYQKVQISRNNRSVAIKKAEKRQAKEQKIRDGLARAEAYSNRYSKGYSKTLLNSESKDKSEQEEILRSHQQAQIADLRYQNHELTKQLQNSSSKVAGKSFASEKTLPAKVTTALDSLYQRLSMLEELQLDTESAHVMERIRNESQDAVGVFKQLQKLNREKQGLAEVLAVLNGLVSDADALLDAEADKLKNKLLTSEAFLKATRSSELRLEKRS